MTGPYKRRTRQSAAGDEMWLPAARKPLTAFVKLVQRARDTLASAAGDILFLRIIFSRQISIYPVHELIAGRGNL
ncbi:hypothetical protein, partial [Erwinia amylovora]|uniref:hypothetical protein n=1 Tax=Erwinia amylovora TaxID=552 RepID=UPI0020C05802